MKIDIKQHYYFLAILMYLTHDEVLQRFLVELWQSFLLIDLEFGHQTRMQA